MVVSLSSHKKIGVVLLLVFVPAGVFLAWWMAQREDRIGRKDLLNQARLVAQAINTDRLIGLTGTVADQENPSYLRVKQQLMSYCTSNNHNPFVYLMGQKPDGALFFYINHKRFTPEDEPICGQLYKKAPSFYSDVFATKQMKVAGPFEDAWGVWITALVPILDPESGELLAVLGMDIDAANWHRRLIRAIMPAVLLTMLLAVLLWIGLVLLQQRSEDESPPHWMWYLEPGLTMLIGLVLTLFAAWLVNDGQKFARKEAFRILGESTTAGLRETLNDIQKRELEGLASFFEGSENVTDEEFYHYCEHLLGDPIVQAWQWVPAVAAADLDRFEQMAAARKDGHFEVWPKQIDGALVNREGYFPVFQSLPIKDDMSIIGYDLGSEPLVRRMFNHAVQSKLLTASLPMVLKPMGTQQVMLVCRPLYAEDDEEQVRGFVVAVMRCEAVSHAIGQGTSVSIMLSLVDMDGAEEVISNSVAVDAIAGDRLKLRRPVFILGRVFVVTAIAGPEFLKHYPMREGLHTAAMGGLLTIVISLMMGAMLHRREVLEELVQQRTFSLRKSQENLRITINSIGDAVIATDNTGRIVHMNPVAEQLTGWPIEDAAGRLLGEVFNVIDGQTRQPCENPVGKVLETGKIIGLANHTLLIAKDGNEYQIADSGSPIRDRNGVITGVVLVFRDVTEDYRIRQELEEKEKQYRALFEHSINGFALHDIVLDENGAPVDYVFREVNNAFEILTGLRREDVVGRRITQAIPTLKEASLVEIYGRVALTGEPARFDFYSEPLQRFYDISAYSPQRGQFATIFTDNTETRKAQEELHFNALVLEQLQDNVTVTDLNGILTYVNEAVSQTLGRSREELIGGHVSIYGEDGGRGATQGKIVEATLEQGHWQGEVINYDSQGHAIVMYSRTSLIRNKEGEPVALCGVGTNVTHQKEIEEQLRHSEQRYALAQKAAHIGSWQLDLATNDVFWSELIEPMFGFQPGEFGRTFDAFMACVHPEDRAYVVRSVQTTFENDHDYDIDFRIIWPDKTERWVNAVGEVVRDEDGQPLQMFGIARDITEEKKAQEELLQYREHLEDLVRQRTSELEESNRELESFAYSISHDLRTPLRGIDGFSKLLMDDYNSVLDEQGRGYLDRIRRASQRLGILIDDILHLSRLSRSAMTVSEVDLSAMAEEILQELSSADRTRHVDWDIQSEMVTHGDATLFRVMLVNLLGNAWKFTSQNPEARINFASRQENGQTVFYVYDNGVGFEMAYVDKIFGVFQRLHNGNEFPGTGVGLATVQRIVHRHGGKIWAESQIGQGATFYFSLPSAS